MKNWKKTLLAILMMTGAVGAQAAVYKTVDGSGNAAYSDSPSKNAKEVTLPPLTIVPSIPVEQTPQVTAPRPVQYRLNFISPLDEQTIRKPDPVEISVDVKPALVQGDNIIILWDGQPVSKTNLATIATEEVDRGEHQVIARILSAQGRTLAEKSTTVYLQQSSVNSPANQAKQPKPGKK